MTRRRFYIHHAAPALVIVGLLASAVAAQSLGDVAKKTAADQEKGRNTPTTTEGKPTPKVSTNERRKTLPPCPGETEASRTAPAASSSETKKDKGYWKNRMRTLKAQLNSDQNELSAASVRLADNQAALATSERAINGDVYVDRTLQLHVAATRNEISRLTARVASDRHQVAELEEEARQAGAPQGWLRQ